MDEKSQEVLQQAANSIAKLLVEYCRIISKEVNRLEFTKDELWEIQDAFRGLNHGASAYERIDRILQKTEPDQ